ncbi:MAG: hypothetical protein KUG79_09050 [Pseudomonadales bacterium]|nr:hypothetical protein [Pseudomonadales bacterium]
MRLLVGLLVIGLSIVIGLLCYVYSQSLPELLSRAWSQSFPFAELRLEYDCGYDSEEILSGLIYIVASSDTDDLPESQYIPIFDKLLACGVEFAPGIPWPLNPLDAALLGGNMVLSHRLIDAGILPSNLICNELKTYRGQEKFGKGVMPLMMSLCDSKAALSKKQLGTQNN